MRRLRDRIASAVDRVIDARHSVVVNVSGNLYNYTTNIFGKPEDAIFDDVPYAGDVGYEPSKACLPNTRTEIVRTLLKWANNNEGPTILWLSGLAGTGKSTIMQSVARELDSHDKLGSSFFFDRAYQGTRRPNNLFSTIALNLARNDPVRKQELLDICDDRSLRTSLSPFRQFDKLLLTPKGSLISRKSVVIVIDALDEAGDRDERAALLAILSDGSQILRLPSHFRILITSRPEQDIYEAFSDKRHITVKRMDEISPEAITRDIAIFIQHELSDIVALERRWPRNEWRNILVRKSERLFQWASAACRFIKDNGQGRDPIQQFELVISAGSQLDQLYTAILSEIFDENDCDSMASFRTILGRVLVAREPLTKVALEHLSSDNDADFIISPLGSVLSGAGSDNVAILPLHSTFRDYLGSPKQSGSFHVESTIAEQGMAMAAAKSLNEGLRFNIGQWENSHQLNRDQELRSLPLHLTYSALFWADHIQKTNFENGTYALIKIFLEAHFLHWLEVLSLLGCTNQADGALSSIAKWCHDQDPDLHTLITDAIRFVRAFGTVISSSAPHIYISALPFAPSSSKISQHYLSQFKQTITVQRGKMERWPALENVMTGHGDIVLCVSYSPDGHRIVSGSDDFTVRVWDSRTGELLVGPFVEPPYTGPPRLQSGPWAVTSVAFSPDGKRIVSGSNESTKNIRLWNSATGDLIGQPFEGHADEVTCVTFLPDGNRILSSSWDETICVSNSTSRERVAGPFKGHTAAVTSVVHSPDGNRIISGSNDNTVRIWDIKTSRNNIGPLIGHTDHVTSVSMSSNGLYIASGSRDKTIRVWHADTGDLLAKPYERHSGIVTSVSFSPDNKHIASGSEDSTVHVWDWDQPNVVSRSHTQHTRPVNSVSFSPDGQHVASGSHDRTVRTWDLAAAEFDIVEAKISASNSTLVCSPDGRRLSVGFNDDTICAWDSHTGAPTAVEAEARRVTDASFSLDGKRIFCGSRDAAARSWNVYKGYESEAIANEEEPKHHITSVAVSPDGQHIVCGFDKGNINMWNMKAGELVSRIFEGHKDAVFCVSFSPDGMRIASGSKDHDIRIWSTYSGDLVAGPFKGYHYPTYGSDDGSEGTDEAFVLTDESQIHDSAISCVVFSPDGLRVASGSDGVILIWDSITGHVLAGPFRDGYRGTPGPSSMAFSPDGRYLISALDSDINVWDSTGITTHPLVNPPISAPKESFTSVSFSPGGQYILTRAKDQWSDRCVRVWRFLPLEKSAAESPGTYDEWSTLEDDGWVKTSQGELLFWLPYENRSGLWMPRNTLVIASKQTKLDLSRFVHGESWLGCYTGGVDPVS